MVSRLTPFGLVLAVLTGCGHYRVNDEFHGQTGFKTSSDYTAPAIAIREPTTSAARPSISAPPPRIVDEFLLRWPVNAVKINRGFRPSSDPAHQGVDFGGSRNTPVLAAHEGVVIYAGHHFQGYGNMVLVEYNKEWATLYAHLNKITVKEGRVVLPGDTLGRMGSTGHASGVHLHFELMQNRQPVDPLPFLSKLGNVTARR